MKKEEIGELTSWVSNSVYDRTRIIEKKKLITVAKALPALVCAGDSVHARALSQHTLYETRLLVPCGRARCIRRPLLPFDFYYFAHVSLAPAKEKENKSDEGNRRNNRMKYPCVRRAANRSWWIASNFHAKRRRENYRNPEITPDSLCRQFNRNSMYWWRIVIRALFFVPTLTTQRNNLM